MLTIKQIYIKIKRTRFFLVLFAHLLARKGKHRSADLLDRRSPLCGSFCVLYVFKNRFCMISFSGILHLIFCLPCVIMDTLADRGKADGYAAMTYRFLRSIDHEKYFRGAVYR